MTTTPAQGPRMELLKIAPDIYAGMRAFQDAAATGLDPALSLLVQIRASQINKCAFCLDMHLTKARESGETQLRLDLLNAWQEVEGLYTEREQAALALTEAVTVLTDGFVPDEVYARAAKHFGETELAHLIAEIAAINSWNRMLQATRAVPASLAKQHRS